MKKILLLTIALFNLSCAQDVKSLDEAPLQLENFDLSTPISTLLPEKTKIKEMNGYYKLKFATLQKDTVYEDKFSEHAKPKWIEYHQGSYSSRGQLAQFGSFNFNVVNFVTSLDDKIWLANALVGEITLEEVQRFIAFMDSKYGKAVKSQGEFFKPFDIYTWDLKDRIIKYSVVHDNEESTLKLEIDADRKTIEAGKKKQHYKAYIYVAGKENAGKVFEGMTTGDLLYCK